MASLTPHVYPGEPPVAANRILVTVAVKLMDKGEMAKAVVVVFVDGAGVSSSFSHATMPNNIIGIINQKMRNAGAGVFFIIFSFMILGL